jgi:hypothetical protein
VRSAAIQVRVTEFVQGSYELRIIVAVDAANKQASS